ncbi:P-loop containing nucleoside triphosphate hydrolase protein [Xylaria arbuscula]|nr:P-loop containing nucleoside triphosphate hydrolase protein [Xylaria arbuscula]
MDVLKILSRGVKKTSKSQSLEFKPAPRVQNPQLYHDKGTKRKRDDQEIQFGRNHDEIEDPSLDFFAPREPSQPKLITQPTVTKEAPKNEAKAEPSLLDDDEVRQVLRSHRLKFTLLSNHEEQKAKVTKSKKKKDVSKVKAKDAKKVLFPQPLVSFTQLRDTWKLSPRLEDNLADQGYRIPTEVQLGSLPVLIRPEKAISNTAAAELNIKPEDGIHFLAVAPTGSGKTLSFLIPAINDILRRRAEVTKDRVLETIVVVPTRELAEQITNEGRKLTKNTGVKIVMMKRGMRLPAEGRTEPEDDSEGSGSESEDDDNSSTGSGINEDDKGKKESVTRTDILITTPLLLGNFLKSRTLPTVRSLILDEGDVLLGQRFLEQTMQIWSACVNPSLRLRCFSATMGAHIEELILNQLSKRDTEDHVAPLVRLVVGLKDTAVPSIGHKLVYTATEQGKLFALRQILHPQSSSASVPDMNLPILVFTQTIERATALHNELKFDFPVEACGPSRIAALHSSLSDSARSDIVRRFRSGEIWALITTDLLMRGLDFRGVSGVINYDVPSSAAAYVHRVGRTGRAGQPGIACTFYTNDDIPYLKSIANVISQSEKQAGKIEDGGVPKWLLESLPKISKEEKKKLKQRGVESRRGTANKITTKSAWERRKENNRREAIASSKKRKLEGPNDNTQDRKSADEEWGGLDD